MYIVAGCLLTDTMLSLCWCRWLTGNLDLWSLLVLRCSSGALQATRRPISLSEMRLTIQRIASRASLSPRIHRQETYRVPVKAALCPLRSPPGCAQLREPLDQEIRSQVRRRINSLLCSVHASYVQIHEIHPRLPKSIRQLCRHEINNLVVLS